VSARANFASLSRLCGAEAVRDAEGWDAARPLFVTIKTA